MRSIIYYLILYHNSTQPYYCTIGCAHELPAYHAVVLLNHPVGLRKITVRKGRGEVLNLFGCW